MSKYICLNCNKEYVSRKKNSKFCSLECKHSYNRFDYNCDCCGKSMIIYRNKYEKLLSGELKKAYCSKECANKGQITSVTKICEYCGLEYKICKSFSETQRFCSKDCMKAFRKENSKEHEVICKQCGKPFITSRDNQVFCSKECSSKSQRNRVECTCKTCGVKFERIKSEVDKNKNHYCSFDCKLADTKWNQHDLNILREYYNKIDNIEIQKMLSKDWTIKAIKAKSQILGLGKNRKWSNEEETLLKEIFPTQSMCDVLSKFPKRTLHSVIGKARTLGLTSKFCNDRKYTNEDLSFLRENYLNMTDEELSQRISGNHSAGGVHQRLCLMGLYRPYEIKKDGYINLTQFVRERLTMWKKEVREYYNYTCCLSGSHSNIIVHHCRSFNLLFDETIDILNFPIKENFTDYTDEELLLFVDKFLEVQDYYNSYVCITEEIHKLFHKEYGYGDNTEEQWEEFVINYKNGKYKSVA